MENSGRSSKETQLSLGKLLEADCDPWLYPDIVFPGKLFVQDHIHTIWSYEKNISNDFGNFHILKYKSGEKPDLEKVLDVPSPNPTCPVFYIDYKGCWRVECQYFFSSGYIDILTTFFSASDEQPTLTPEIPNSFALAPY